ncbi:YHS domain-containing (seleno)protein [Ensifer soli]|uniref:YHS domain-containing (seleno)protein n=1 Tax=Ciceribacter sp. sgz301302 TaxID=3342379 RepID=UPI0035BA2080
MTKLIPSVLGVSVMVMMATQGVTGEINTTKGIAISGYDAVAYFTEEKPVKGSEAYSVTYKDADYLFSSAQNRDAFSASPETYLPQYGGYCAYGTAAGYKAPIDPSAFTLEGGKLYLNYSKSIQKTWRQDMSGYIRKADDNWPTVKAQ